jgi:hypothetical protein
MARAALDRADVAGRVQLAMRVSNESRLRQVRVVGTPRAALQCFAKVYQPSGTAMSPPTKGQRPPVGKRAFSMQSCRTKPVGVAGSPWRSRYSVTEKSARSQTPTCRAPASYISQSAARHLPYRMAPSRHVFRGLRRRIKVGRFPDQEAGLDATDATPASFACTRSMMAGPWRRLARVLQSGPAAYSQLVVPGAGR